MNLNITINLQTLNTVSSFFKKIKKEKLVVALSAILSIAAILFCYANDYIVTYGDSESHLNISKRVVNSITPGFAQLGGIWLPIPHLLMAPFVEFDFLWRTGLAGSIVSGAAFVVASLFIYKTAVLLTHNKTAGLVASLVFMLNPNVLYLQTTPMTEMVLIAFFTLSTYYFIRFLQGTKPLASILLAAFFGFCSVLTRYDGWFLVVLQAGAIGLYYLPWDRFPRSWRELKSSFDQERFKTMQGYIVIFSTLAFFGIAIWLMWGFLILGDPLFFTHSQFSAKSQQNEWLSKGQLPAYHNLLLSFIYYFVTAMSNAGVIMFGAAIIGLVYYISQKKNKHRLLVTLVLAAPFIFNVITQYLGQSVIFIPHLTPTTFEWTLFNVRYGVMTVPLVAIFVGYLFYRSKLTVKYFLLALMLVQLGLYGIGYSPVISWADGVEGLSSAKRPDAESWMRENYDRGLVLMDDFARTVSVVRSGVPMENMIYVGNKPYWEESLKTPEKYARWVVIQENDTVWKALWEKQETQGNLYKYFEKAYTSPEILVFRRNNVASDFDQTAKFWSHQCVDTMKYSRDQAREIEVRPDLNQFLENEMNIVASTGANCVAIGTPYDDEFIPFLKAWVTKAHDKGLRVWFRGNMSSWQGWFSYPKYKTVAQHHVAINNFITKNPDLFAAGDIFTPAPEPENGIIGDPRQSAANREAFLKFLPDSYNNCVEAFSAIGKNVTCGYFSVNGDVAKQILTKEVVNATGNLVVIDHYVADPNAWADDIKFLNEKLGVKVMIGEFGAPIPDIHGTFTAEEQAKYIEQMLSLAVKEKDIIVGLNYWVLRGGTTALVSETGEIKPGLATLKNYYLPATVEGKITDTLGKPISGAIVSGGNLQTTSDKDGNYSIVVPANTKTLTVTTNSHFASSQTINLLVDLHYVFDFSLEPYDKTFIYKFESFFKRLLGIKP